MRYPNEETKEKVRVLRKNPTPAESALWGALRGQKLDGLKFRRQHPIGAFVVDFCCTSHQLIVELDGGIHDEQIEYDLERTNLIQARGYRVIRFRNELVFTDLPTVLQKIAIAAGTRHPLARGDGRGGWG
jgi:phosphoribosylformylglycinamidine synthase